MGSERCAQGTPFISRRLAEAELSPSLRGRNTKSAPGVFNSLLSLKIATRVPLAIKAAFTCPILDSHFKEEILIDKPINRYHLKQMQRLPTNCIKDFQIMSLWRKVRSALPAWTPYRRALDMDPRFFFAPLTRVGFKILPLKVLSQRLERHSTFKVKHWKRHPCAHATCRSTDRTFPPSLYNRRQHSS